MGIGGLPTWLCLKCQHIDSSVSTFFQARRAVAWPLYSIQWVRYREELAIFLLEAADGRAQIG
jgi:hypothetical protein